MLNNINDVEQYEALLKVCLHAFNCLPNTKLDIEGVKNTYVLDSKIEFLLKEGESQC